MRTCSNLPRHELIGLRAEVVKSTDPGKLGFRGRVVDETRNTIVLETARGEKRVPKSEVDLRFELEDDEIMINGSRLLFRPEDRLKKAKELSRDSRRK